MAGSTGSHQRMAVVVNIGLSSVRRARDGGVRRQGKNTNARDGSALASLFSLQRLAGNRAVTTLIGRSGIQPASALLVQRAAGKLTFTDLPLGTNASGTLVKAKRVIGSEQGYADRWQATAVARLAKTDPAAVVKRADTKQWCAVEASAAFATGLVGSAGKGGDTTTGMSTGITAVHGLPSLAGLPQVMASVKQLKQRSRDLSATQPKNKAEEQALDAEKDKVREQLSRENLRRMALILGVAETEIQPNRSSVDRAIDKINVTGLPSPDSSGGAHGPVTGQKDTSFSPTLETAMEIDENQFDNLRAQSALFHEAHHLGDMKLAKDWVLKYQTEANKTWVAGPPGVKPFMAWLNAQVKRKRLTAGDAQMIIDESLNLTATTEARANIHTFLAILQAGDGARALKELQAYARALKPGGRYASPPDNTPVLTELVAELKAAYKTMAPAMQADYRAAVNAAIAEYPKAWITTLKFFK
jgi:hypothetical protein